jgi:hypothetical protein
MYIQYIRVQGLFQSRLGTADYALVISSLHYNDSLVTWTVVHMTASKFKHLSVFSVSGFALSNITNNCIFMILDDFCLLPAWFCYVIINVRYMENLMHIVNRCALRKIANGRQGRVTLGPTVSQSEYDNSNFTRAIKKTPLYANRMHPSRIKITRAVSAVSEVGSFWGT